MLRNKKEIPCQFLASMATGSRQIAVSGERKDKSRKLSRKGSSCWRISSGGSNQFNMEGVSW